MAPSTTSTLVGSNSGEQNTRCGMLTIVIFSGRRLSLPAGAQVPTIIERAVQQHRAQIANGHPNGPPQKKRHWWLPYIVIGFDRGEILVDGLGGDLSNPVWNYRAHL